MLCLWAKERKEKKIHLIYWDYKVGEQDCTLLYHWTSLKLEALEECEVHKINSTSKIGWWKRGEFDNNRPLTFEYAEFKKNGVEYEAITTTNCVGNIINMGVEKVAIVSIWESVKD